MRTPIYIEGRIFSVVLFLSTIFYVDGVFRRSDSLISVFSQGIFAPPAYILIHDAAITITLLIASFILLFSGPPRDHYHGAGPNIVATVGAFSQYVLAIWPRGDQFSIHPTVSFAFVTVGAVISLIAIVELRGSFSITPQFRSLQTRGLYAFVRHPMYFGGMLAVTGLVLLKGGYFHIVLGCIIMALQIARALLEERVIGRNSPEYQKYRNEVGFLFPRLSVRQWLSRGISGVIVVGTLSVQFLYDDFVLSTANGQEAAPQQQDYDAGAQQQDLVELVTKSCSALSASANTAFSASPDTTEYLRVVLLHETTAVTVPVCTSVLRDCPYLKLKAAGGTALSEAEKVLFTGCVIFPDLNGIGGSPVL